MISFNKKHWRIFHRLQKKHNVSLEFLLYNRNNIEKIVFYETCPRYIIKRYAIRKKNRVFLISNCLRRVLFEESRRKLFARFRLNLRQWSKRIVAFRRRTEGTEEYVEEIFCAKKSTTFENNEEKTNDKTEIDSGEDVSQQLKKQLELLKSGRRQLPFISLSANDDNHEENKSGSDTVNTECANIVSQKENPLTLEKENNKVLRLGGETLAAEDWQEQTENTPEKQLICHEENVQPFKQLATDENTEISINEESNKKKTSGDKMVKTGLKFLDMLMCKVTGGQNEGSRTENTGNNETKEQPVSHDFVNHREHSLDSSDEFLGFEEPERLPGMLMTPLVPFSGGKNKNSIFISETLNEYMRANDLETDYNIDNDKSILRPKIIHTDFEGLMTPNTQPPPLDMPEVPDRLLKFRTVAERKNYLSKSSKNNRLSIISNEANIYRELQKRMLFKKTKHTSQLLAQSPNSSMSFTRIGWQTASFINTEFNKYYYQLLNIDNGKHIVRLKGVRGNNQEFRKKPHYSMAGKKALQSCPPSCVDLRIWQDFKPSHKLYPETKKLNRGPLPSGLKPCPLSHKVLQKPLDDDAAALLLAGGGMAVVRMPMVELEVFPECGKPLNEIAKRYLQYILPHHDISREWAEFSVSTLRMPSTIKEAVQAAADSIPRRKSFTFLIPYLNDQNHILVRRVVDRSEKLDESFENSLETELVPKTDFVFRQNLDETDEVLLDCADIVSDMINTVAISCSENSFIKIDPDMLDEDKTDKRHSPTKIKRPASVLAHGSPPPKKPTKQKRVLMELKRLNATIINAAAKPDLDDTPCTKEYCIMGCICNSLAEGSRLREHCGKAKCILECSCKSPNQSRIMRLETDVRSITTEDAFMLRRKATARLARMEKEFTSTVVLTENETLLINETNNDKKRRCTKAPKRYEYPEDSEEDSPSNSPKKTNLTTIDNEKMLAFAVQEIRHPIYVKESDLEQLKHCTVNLVKLQDMENVAPWCMVHHLYKCFCKGRALEGNPMIIKKDENNSNLEQHMEDKEQSEVDYKSNSKARYTFEKVERGKRKYTIEDDDAEEEDEEEQNSEEELPAIKKPAQLKSTEKKDKRKQRFSEEETKLDAGVLQVANKVKEIPPATSGVQKDKPKRNLQDVREGFYAPRPDCCRRQIPIPRRLFLYCNSKRRLDVIKYIKTNETEKTRLLLNEHIMRSVYYHKIDNEKIQKQKDDEQQAATNNQIKVPTPIKEDVEQNKNETLVAPEIVDLSEEVENLITDKESNLNRSTKFVSAANNKNDAMTSQNTEKSATNKEVITMKQFATLTGSDVAKNSMLTNKDNKDANQQSPLPKISNCFSLNAKANLQKPLKPANTTETKQFTEQLQLRQQQPHLADFTSAASVHSPAFNSSRKKVNVQHTSLPSEVKDTPTESQLPPGVDSESIRDVYNNVIRTMNTLVSKKMQDVDFAIKRDSQVIPTPNADILCMMKWSNFLDAFCHGFSFIWQVKSRDNTYLVATVRNLLPMISDALGVVNITALKPDRLPLMGKMLLQNVSNEHTAKLAIVMQGKPAYWVVKGFLKAEPTTACNKPTPETHPSLTKKINILCTSLVKQKQREEKSKDTLVQRWSAPAKREAKIAQIIPTPRMPTTIARQIGQIPSPATMPIQSMTADPQSNQNNLFLSNTPVVVPTTPTTQTNNLINSTQNARKRKSSGEPVTNPLNNLSKMDLFAKMSTNIEFRKISREDVDEISLPEVHKNNHKWLVLDLHNDFSHIFVPDFSDLVSLDRIQKVINFARQKNKIVKLQFFQNAPFDAFVTPKSARKIYFGPLNIKMKPPTLILLQSVDGQMMIRESYLSKHNIQNMRQESTKALWVFQINGQTQFDYNMEGGNKVLNAEMGQTENKQVDSLNDVQDDHDDDDDEDCMIVENDIEEDKQRQKEKEKRFNFTIRSKPNDNNLSITPQINSLPGPPPIQKLNNFVNTSMNNLVGTSTNTSLNTLPILHHTIPNTNTVIKPILPTTNTLLELPTKPVITGIAINTPTNANSDSSMKMNINVNSNPLKLPPNAVVTGITPAPEEASYGSTIYITKNIASSQIQVSRSNDLCRTNAIETQLSARAPPPPYSQAIKTSEVITVYDDVTASQQGPHEVAEKRRKISSINSNPEFDINSQSINAVINKLLTDNAQQVQVKNAEPSNAEPANEATIGATRIAKVLENVNNQQQQEQQETNKKLIPDISFKPVVYDVNFPDSMNEPLASVVFKPPISSSIVATSTVTTMSEVVNSSSVNAGAYTNVMTTVSRPISTTNVTFSTAKPITKPQITFLNSETVKAPQALTTIPNALNVNQLQQKFNIKSANNSNNKSIKIIKIPSSAFTVSNASQVSKQGLNNVLGTKCSPVMKLAASSTANITAVQKNTLMNKTVLNTLNPIKITPITPSPTTRATIKPLGNVITSASFTPITTSINAVTSTAVTQSKDNVKVLSPANLASRCVTIREIVPKANAAEVLPTTQTVQANPITTIFNSPTAVPISKAITSSTASSSSLTAASSLMATTPVYTTPNRNINIIPTTSNRASMNNTSTPPLVQSKVKPVGTPSTLTKVITVDDDNSTTLPSNIEYGHIVSTFYKNFKFVAKRIMDEFYVKVPTVGILKLTGLQAVNNYLNKHMFKSNKNNINPGNWIFQAASEAIQKQNHQKALLARKTQSMEFQNRINTGETAANRTQKVVNATPILIDD